MALFSLGGNSDRFGIVIDIGSGSVLTSIVHSNSENKHPVIVWAHREHIALKNIDNIEHSAKAVLAALMNASLKLDGEGRKALMEYNSSAKLTLTQCSISAPWSYTVTKTINLKQDEPIDITENFVDELVFAAQRQVEEELKENATASEIGLTVIAKSTMDLLSNGYRVSHPEGEKASTMSLTQATVVAQQYMMDGITEVHEKLFPKANVEAMSFILMLYCTIRSLHPHTDDFCLVDVTDEATEIGIVRDGSLKYSTHIPFGMFSLAREISNICKIPLHEALGYLRAKDVNGVKQHLPESSYDEVTVIFDKYLEKLAGLLNETGDSLSIPKQVLLNVESSFEPLFSNLLSRAAKSATKIDHLITSISTDVIPSDHKAELKKHIGDYANDTALLLNAEFFHKQQHCLDFNYS